MHIFEFLLADLAQGIIPVVVLVHQVRCHRVAKHNPRNFPIKYLANKYIKYKIPETKFLVNNSIDQILIIGNFDGACSIHIIFVIGG